MHRFILFHFYGLGFTISHRHMTETATFTYAHKSKIFDWCIRMSVLSEILLSLLFRNNLARMRSGDSYFSLYSQVHHSRASFLPVRNTKITSVIKLSIMWLPAEKHGIVEDKLVLRTTNKDYKYWVCQKLASLNIFNHSNRFNKINCQWNKAKQNIIKHPHDHLKIKRVII